MQDLDSVQERNRELARVINEQARSDPSSNYKGKYIGLANGQVVVVADSLDDVVHRLEVVEPDPRRSFCIEAGLDYDTPQNV